jgi:hypothetical protein
MSHSLPGRNYKYWIWKIIQTIANVQIKTVSYKELVTCILAYNVGLDAKNNSVFWDVAPCRYFVNRRFGGTYRLNLQGRRIRERGTSVSRWLQWQFWRVRYLRCFTIKQQNLLVHIGQKMWFISLYSFCSKYLPCYSRDIVLLIFIHI